MLACSSESSKVYDFGHIEIRTEVKCIDCLVTFLDRINTIVEYFFLLFNLFSKPRLMLLLDKVKICGEKYRTLELQMAIILK